MAASQHGLGYRVVRELSQPFVGKHHHIFCNNFFTSIKLACDLLRDETYMCGTIRPNRRGFPNGLSPQKAEVKALRKGESKFYRRGNLVASVWKDTKLVCFLSTQSSPVGDKTVNRKQCDGTIIQVPTVPAAMTWTTSKEIIMLGAANGASGGVICCGFLLMWALSMVTFWKLKQKIIALDHNCSFASSWQTRLSGNLVRVHLVFRKGAWLVDTGL